MADDAAAKRASYVKGLQTERDMYAAAGRDDRVAQVNAEIARVTGEPPKRRRAVRKETA